MSKFNVENMTDEKLIATMDELEGMIEDGCSDSDVEAELEDCKEEYVKRGL